MQNLTAYDSIMSDSNKWVKWKINKYFMEVLKIAIIWCTFPIKCYFHPIEVILSRCLVFIRHSIALFLIPCQNLKRYCVSLLFKDIIMQLRHSFRLLTRYARQYLFWVQGCFLKVSLCSPWKFFLLSGASLREHVLFDLIWWKFTLTV